MKFNDLFRQILVEEVDFDSKTGFEVGSELRNKIDEIHFEMKKSKFLFKDYDYRNLDGFIFERCSKLIENNFSSKEIAEVLLKFAYLVKFHAKDLEQRSIFIDPKKYTFKLLKHYTDTLYDLLHKQD